MRKVISTVPKKELFIILLYLRTMSSNLKRKKECALKIHYYCVILT